MIVLNWVTEHFLDFEGSDKMNCFLDWFEEMLVEEVCASDREEKFCYYTCMLGIHVFVS